MNDSELDKTLKAAGVPERAEDYWHDFPRRVVVGLRTARREAPRERTLRPRLAWGFGLAFACIALGFALGHWHERSRRPEMLTLLQDGKVLREVLTLFPHRVRAIVQDARGVHLVLSDKPDVPDSTPLWLSICEGNRCRTVVTFSGQDLQIAKDKVEVLVDAQGQVMLVGDRLFWSSTGPTRLSANLRIQARPLAYTM